MARKAIGRAGFAPESSAANPPQRFHHGALRAREIPKRARRLARSRPLAHRARRPGNVLRHGAPVVDCVPALHHVGECTVARQ